MGNPDRRRCGSCGPVPVELSALEEEREAPDSRAVVDLGAEALAASLRALALGGAVPGAALLGGLLSPERAASASLAGGGLGGLGPPNRPRCRGQRSESCVGPREGALEGMSPSARSLLLPPPHPQATWARVLGRGHPPCSAWARAALTPHRRGAEADGPQTRERGRGSLRLSSQRHPPQRLEALPSVPSPGSLFSPVELPGGRGEGLLALRLPPPLPVMGSPRLLLYPWKEAFYSLCHLLPCSGPACNPHSRRPGLQG